MAGDKNIQRYGGEMSPVKMCTDISVDLTQVEEEEYNNYFGLIGTLQIFKKANLTLIERRRVIATLCAYHDLPVPPID